MKIRQFVVSLASVSILACGGAKDKKAEVKVEKTPDNAVKLEAPVKPEAAAEKLAIAELPGALWEKFNARDFDGYGALFTPDATSIEAQVGEPDNGRDAIVAAAKENTTVFSDVKGHPLLVLADPNANRVFQLSLVTGTHDGAMKTDSGEVAATNKKMGIMVASVLEIKDGLVAKQLEVYDPGAIMSQLGVAPIPARPALSEPPAAAEKIVSAGNEVEKANLAVVEKSYATFNAHDIAANSALFADDAIESDQSSPADVTGKAEMEKGIKELYGAFSDFKATPEGTLAAGNYVVAWGTAGGTNDGAAPTWGIKKPTGKSAEVHFIEVMEMSDGKIKKTTRLMNGLAFAKQLGLVEDKPAIAQK